MDHANPPPHAAIWALFFAAIAYGVATGHFAAHALPIPGHVDFGFTVLATALAYWWYRLDAEARGRGHSAWLGGFIIALAIVALPYYLLRSRPAGRRLRALATYVGLFACAVGTVSLIAQAVLFLET